MSMTDTALGYEFQHWAARLIAVFGYREKIAEGFERGDVYLSTEASRRTENEESVRLDVLIGTAGNSSLLVGEIKWTRVDPLGMLRKALEYTQKIENTTHRVIVIGAPTEKLRPMTLQEILGACGEIWPFAWKVSYQVKDSNSGTAVFDLNSPKSKLTIFLIAFGEESGYEFSKALALRLTGYIPPKDEEPYAVPVDLEALAESQIEPLLRNLLGVPVQNDEALDLKNEVASLPPDRFLLDPWSYLAEAFLRHQSVRAPKKYRWVRLLHAALHRQCGGHSSALQLLPSEEALAAKIPPLPLRCGHRSGSEIINDLESAALEASRPSRGASGQVRIITGTAGTGKSTLLEFLFNNHVDRLRRGSGAAPSAGLPIFIDLQRDSEVLKSLREIEADASISSKRGVVARVLDQLIGPFHEESWLQSDRRADVEQQHKFTTLEALLLHYKLYLYVDGFDQLAVIDNRLLANLGRTMRTLQYEMAFLVLTSRPQHDELRAFDWPDTFPGADVPTRDSVLSLAKPEFSDLQDYCEAWLGELHLIFQASGRASPPEPTAAREFLERWLPMTTEEPADNSKSVAEDARAAAILQNPLLLAMALSIYLKRLGHQEIDNQLILNSQADLFEAIMQELPVPDHPMNLRTGVHTGGHIVVVDSTWRRWIERCCYEALTRTGRTTGRLEIHHLKQRWDQMMPESEFASRQLDLPFLQRREGVDDDRAILEFVHPAFHEYLAASYLARSLSNARFPSPGSRSELIGVDDAIRLRAAEGIVTTPLAQAIVAMGRDSFKYLLGRALSDARQKPTSRNSLVLLAQLIECDYGLQQYLYDAGFVDRCLHEMEIASENGIPHRSEGSDGFRKLIGHTYYGRQGFLEKGVAMLLIVAEDVLGSRPTILDRWFAIFCLDHVENRLFRVRTEIVESEIELKYRRSTILGKDIRSWIEDRWTQLVGGLEIFQPVEGAFEGNVVRSLALVPEPAWENELPFVLRAAHYWGHVGNRVLFRQAANPEVDLGMERSSALQAYARAVVYRLVGLFLSVGKQFEEEIREAIGPKQELPPWFDRWVASGASEDIGLALRVGARSLAAFERFIGPGQAIADTANQFSCRANLLLWEVGFTTDPAERDNVFEASEQEYASSGGLWKLAKSERIQGFHGETLIRYYLHLAGLDVRRELARQMIAVEPLWSEEKVRDEAKRRLEAMERDYGMSYSIAWSDVLTQCGAYRRLLSRRIDS